MHSFFPLFTPSSYALSPSVMTIRELRWRCTQMLSLQLFPLLVLVLLLQGTAAHFSAPGCNKLSYSPSTCQWHSHDSQPASSTMHTEKTISKSFWSTPLLGAQPEKNRSWTWRMFSEENQTSYNQRTKVTCNLVLGNLLQLQQCLCFTSSHNSFKISLKAISCAALPQPLSLVQN